MTDIDAQAKFITKAHKAIEQVRDEKSYRLAIMTVTGAKEYRSLPETDVNDLLRHLERKRVEIVRASGALVG